MTSSQQSCEANVQDTGADDHAYINSNESKIASDTLLQSLEPLPPNIIENEGSDLFEDNEIVPRARGTNYQDFVLFPNSFDVPPIDDAQFFADADATTASDQSCILSTVTDPTLFLQQDIAHRPKRDLTALVSSNPYDAVNYESFVAMEEAAQQAVVTGELQQQKIYSPTLSHEITPTLSDEIIPTLDYSTTSYNDSISSPIEAWANTIEPHELFAYRFARLPYGFGGVDESQDFRQQDVGVGFPEL